jgi:PKD repeat protein
MNRSWIAGMIALLLVIGFQAAQTQIYFFEDFENGLDNNKWEVSGHDWGLLKADSSKSPWDAIDNFCLDSNPGRSYYANINTSATLITLIDIRSSIHPVLSFWVRNYMAWGDNIHLELSNDNGFTWKTLWSRGESVFASWHRISVDMEVEKNKKFILRFRISTNHLHESRGCLIDNITIDEFDFGHAINLPFEDRFEDTPTLTNWEVSGHDWNITDETSQEGKNCLTDSPRRNYWQYAYNRAILKGHIDLHSDGNFILTMWHKYYLSYGESIQIQVSTDSGWTWQAIASWGEGTLNSWQKVQLDLNRFNGKRIKLCFHLKSNDIHENNGWFIDNLKIHDAANENPLIDTFTASTQQGYKPLPVQFTCQAHDPDGNISEYRWDIDGDGRPDTTTTTGSLAYTYQTAGIYETTCTVTDNGGASATSQKLYITVLSSEARRLCLADTSALSGSTLKIPLRIDDATGLAAIQGRLVFSSAILEARKIEQGVVTKDFSLSDSLMSGKAAFSLARANGLASGPADLLYVHFLVKATANKGDTCSIVLERLSLFDENGQSIPATATKALFTVTGTASQAGFFIQPDTLALLPSQSQTLIAFTRGADSQSTPVSAAWAIEPLSEIGKTRIVGNLSATSGAQISIKATRIGDSRIIARSGDKADTTWVYVKGLSGDATADSLIAASDAQQVLRAAINLPLAPVPPGHVKPTRYERYAMDYNVTGTINVDDAKLILDKSLEGLLRKRTISRGSGPAFVFMDTESSGQDRWIYTIRVHEREDIGAGRIVIRFDTGQLTLSDVQAYASGGQWLRNDTAPGRIMLGMIHPESLVASDGTLFKLHFRSKNYTETPTVAIESAELFDGQAQAISTVISEQTILTAAIPSSFGLDQNYPNPFNPITTIHYHLATEAQVELRVYNANGQSVRVLMQDHRSAGTYQAEWDGRDDFGQALGSGIYFCRLQVNGNGLETIKMVLMR